MFKYFFIFFIASLLICSINAQEPSYSIIGENELAGLDIYTLAQDKNNYIWIGTENGIYRYDGYVFKKYNNDNLKAKSVFGFMHDNFGDLYCFNLSGQILNVKGDSIKIIYQIPDSLMSSFYEIGFDNENNLVVAGKRPFKVGKNYRPKLFFDDNSKLFMAAFKKSKKDLIFSYINENTFKALYLKNE